MKPGGWLWEEGLSMARKLAVARHAPGFDAVGWVLLGFVLGAGLAVFALLHADILRRAPPPSPPPAVRASLEPAPMAPLVPAVAPLPAITPVGPAKPALPASASPPGPDALASAGAASAKGVAVAAKADISPSQPPPSSDQQVANDAAAAGMTSRKNASDLY